MLSFRQRIFTGYLIVFIFFLSLIFPFSSRTVKQITYRALRDRANELIAMLQQLPTEEAMLQRLKLTKSLVFFRVTIVNDEQQVIFDSHIKGNPGVEMAKRYAVSHPEIIQAIREGEGYYVGYSELLGQELSYMAKAFDFHGKTYIMRIAFPYRYIVELTHNFEIGFLGLVTAVLLLFSLMTWVIIHHLTNPIQQIINAIRPYQEGSQAVMPQIAIKGHRTEDEFTQLAQTLNTLSNRIRSHIDALTIERNEKEAILESLNEGVIAVNENLEITYVNSMALKLLGGESLQLLGHNIAALGQSQCMTLLLECQQKQQAQSDTLHVKLDQERRYLQIIAVPKGEKRGAVLVIQDQTVQHKMLEMRKDFVANASHELKTPITIILGFAEALHDNPQLPVATVEEITTKIVVNCQRMDNLIKDLLTLSDIEQLSVHLLCEVDLLEVVKNCQKMVLSSFPKAEIALACQTTEPFILAVPNLVEMAVFNLMENAAKYSPEPAQISVTLQKKEQYIEMVIADKGYGIPEEDLEHIFQRFYRHKAYKKRIKGSGLGLAIVETIIEKHRAKIWVQSQVGHGSLFTLLWPTP